MADKVADEGKLLEKLHVCRKELKNIRDEMLSTKRMFIKKFKHIENLLKDSLATKMSEESGIDSSVAKWKNQPKRTSALPGLDVGTQGIGLIKSCFKQKNGTPRQPSVCLSSKAKLTVSSTLFNNPYHSLEGLEKFSHIWLIFLFHENTNKTIKAKVHPPRLDGASIGVFATRSPHRPVPIGLSLVKLDSIQGNTLFLSGVDLLHNTPVLDIKPYIPGYDMPQSTYPNDNACCNATDVMAASSSERPAMLHEDSPNIPGFPTQTSVLLESQVTSIPDWVTNAPVVELKVVFSEHAEKQMQMFSCHDSRSLDQQDTSHQKSQHRFLNVEERKTLKIPSVDVPETGELSPSLKKHCSTDSRFFHNQETHDNYSHKMVFNLEEKLEDGNPVQHSQTLKIYHDNKSQMCFNQEETFVPPVQQHSPLKKQGADFKNKVYSNEETGQASKEEIHAIGKQHDAENDVAMYHLEMFSSLEEARSAITDVLKADPRSVYRRNCCADQLYYFSIDKINLSCKFGEGWVEVVSIVPTTINSAHHS